MFPHRRFPIKRGHMGRVWLWGNSAHISISPSSMWQICFKIRKSELAQPRPELMTGDQWGVIPTWCSWPCKSVGGFSHITSFITKHDGCLEKLVVDWCHVVFDGQHCLPFFLLASSMWIWMNLYWKKYFFSRFKIWLRLL